MNAKTSVFLICIEDIINFLLYNLHDCTLNGEKYTKFVYFTLNRMIFYKTDDNCIYHNGVNLKMQALLAENLLSPQPA